MPEFAFTRAERLSGERNIARLFGEGTGGFTGPFRYVFLTVPADGEEGPEPGVAVLVSVPKRNHKTAVSRNLLKRRTREAYRLNKSGLAGRAVEKKMRVSLGLIYVSKDVSDFQTIEDAVRKIIKTVARRL